MRCLKQIYLYLFYYDMSTDQKQHHRYGLGYVPDLMDFRDYSKGDKEVKEIFNKLSLETDPTAIPPTSDYRNKFTSVRSQGNLGSCTGFSSKFRSSV